MSLENRTPPLGGCDGGVLTAGQFVAIQSLHFSRNNARTEGESFSDSLFPIESVHSIVYWTHTAALAKKELAAIETQHARACERSPEAHVSTLSPTIPRAFGLRIATPSPIPARGTAGRSTYYTDLFGFVVGRALVTLTANGDPRPFPAATEHRVLMLLYSRAKAHEP